MSKGIRIFIVAALAVSLCISFLEGVRNDALRAKCEKLQANTETLLSDVEQYRVRDSLSAARVQSLELTVKEFERFRADDAALIKQLKARNRDLAAVNKTQSETIIELRAAPRDTVIIRDSIPIQAVAVHCGDAWFDFDGLLTDKEFTGKLQHRDSLMLVETVKYKRFLGFLWKTNRVKDRQLDCVSKSPHNRILGLEYVVIEK